MSDSNTNHNGHSASHEREKESYVKLIVGRGRGRELESIPIHTDVFRKSSAFFKGPLTSEKPTEIRLPDEDHFIIQKYVSWLYCHKVDRMVDHMDSYPSMAAATWELNQLKELHGFATKIKDEEFQYEVTNALLATWHQRRSMERDV